MLCYRDRLKEISGRADIPSSNAVHIASATYALEALKRRVRVHFYTASDYLRDGATKWIEGWRRRCWTTREGKPVASRYWWERLDAVSRPLEVSWHVVRKYDAPPHIDQARGLARAALAEDR